VNTVQQSWTRRSAPRMLLATLAGVVTVLSALAVSRADIGSAKPVAVTTLSGDTAGAPLPADAGVLPGEDLSAAQAEVAPDSPPTTSAAPTSTTVAARPTTHTAKAGVATAAAVAVTNRACPPPCAQPASPPTGSTEPARPACPPPPCDRYDTVNGGAGCPQPCPAYATADGKPAPCPPPPPCAYPTEPDGGIGDTKPASTTAGGTDPVPPSQSCPPPPCPSAAPTQGCTPPCSYPGSDGQAAGSFAPCPAASGVEGRVTAGPTCPVERSDQPCPDKPVETTLRLVRKDGSVATTTKSGPDGTFKVAVAPGSYRLEADWPSRIGGCTPVDVTVERGRFTHADVSCDTGIR
jgi:hypothetical protein